MKKIFNRYFMFLPLILVEAYLVFTVLLYQFGPLDWKTENKAMFWFFLLAYHVAFIVGYVLSIKKIKIKKTTWNIEKKTYNFLTWLIILVCIVCACIEYKNLTHASSYIPYELLGNFIKGLINPGEQYYNKFTSDEYVSNKMITILSAVFSFIYVSIIPFLVVYWKRVTFAQKVSFLTLIFFRVVVYVSIGTNKGIFDTMFNFVGILLILILLNIYRGSEEHIDKKSFIQVSVLAISLVVFSFSYFTVNISSRVESPVDYAISGTGVVTEEMSEEVPEEDGQEKSGFFKNMYYSVSNYITQGYYGMSLSLDEEFTTTYGIGNSQFLKSNFKSLFGIDVQDRTYQHKITDRWDENGHWHSFYSYIANDVSFYGVIGVMFALGLYFGCICKDVILNNSLIGKMLLPLFMIMIMYMPANNQVFTAMATFTAFFELTFLWFLSKSKWIKGIVDGK